MKSIHELIEQRNRIKSMLNAAILAKHLCFNNQIFYKYKYIYTMVDNICHFYAKNILNSSNDISAKDRFSKEIYQLTEEQKNIIRRQFNFQKKLYN